MKITRKANPKAFEDVSFLNRALDKDSTTRWYAKYVASYGDSDSTVFATDGYRMHVVRAFHPRDRSPLGLARGLYTIIQNNQNSFDIVSAEPDSRNFIINDYPDVSIVVDLGKSYPQSYDGYPTNSCAMAYRYILHNYHWHDKPYSINQDFVYDVWNNDTEFWTVYVKDGSYGDMVYFVNDDDRKSAYVMPVALDWNCKGEVVPRRDCELNAA